MHIIAICPQCETRYQLDLAMRGKRTRCTNPWCRAIFEVREEAAPGATPVPPPEPSTPASLKQVSGSVGDIIPILTAEQADPAPAPPAVVPPVPAVRASVPLVAAEAVTPPRELPRKEPKPAWQEPPPVRKRSTTGAETAPPAPAPRPTVPAKEPAPTAPRPQAPAPQVPALDWGPLGEFFNEEAAPAVPASNGPMAEAAAPSEPAANTWEAPPIRGPILAAEPRPTSVAPAPEPATPATARRRSWKLVGSLAVALALFAGWLFWQYQKKVMGNEAERLAQAEERYNNRSFDDAAARFNKLYADFPESPNRPLYRFLAELSSLRDPVYNAQLDADDARPAFDHLREFVAGYKDDPLLDRYQGDLWDTFYRLSEKVTDAAAEKHDRGLHTLAQAARDQAKNLKAPIDSAAEKKVRDLENKLAAVAHDLDDLERKRAVLTQVTRVRDNFSFTEMQRVIALVQEKGLTADPDIAKVLAELPAKHRDSVRYTAAPPGQADPPPSEDQEPTLIIAPVAKRRIGEVEAGARPILGMDRGVLYALDPGRGKLRWARRVSIDSTALPLRLPPTPIAPELVLALTPDSYTLTALDADNGTRLWHRRLKAACLGNPVIVGNRAFVPTDQGFVEEIDTTEGTLLGYYTLGQPLTVGGVRQPGTNLVYFPADSHSVYVLDVAARTCIGVLYTGHPEGSLRGAPVMLREPTPGGQDKGAARFSLLLSQEDGLDRVKLRAFPLPITDPNPGKRQRERSLAGWSWFPPYVDSERLAQVADNGRFVLFGIEPRDARAVRFFPMVKEEIHGGGAGRAQIVHADAEHFWVLADGWLHKLLMAFDRKEGPRLLHRPLGPEPFGSALHASQVRTEADGTATLFLVTRARDGHTCLASAIDARRGTAYWQRQLGLVCQGQPTRLGNQVLVQEQGGSLYLFDAGKHKGRHGPWQQAGRKVAAALPTQVGPAYILAAPDGASVYVVASTSAPPKLVVRTFQAGKDEPTTREYSQQAPLAGTPGLGADALVLPLANGILVRQALAGGAAVAGPNWRAAHAEGEAVGHVVALGGDEFLVTDGSSGLQRLYWPAGNMAESKAATVLANRIIAAPVVLPATGEVRVCVTDAANTLTLLQGEALQPVRQWPMNGQITAGPFVRGRGMGCVVDRRRLVWLDPDRDQPVWAYAFAADIVGEPQLIAPDLLVVADLSGTFSGFHPATGQMVGPGYTLRANVAPAAAPVAFGPDRLFAPLTDGTILLLSRRHFQHPLRGMPSIW